MTRERNDWNEHSETRVVKPGMLTPGQETIQERLEQAVDAKLSAIHEACERGGKRPAIPNIAESIYGEQPQLMEEAKRPVILDRLCWLLRQRRAARRARDFGQMELPGLELPRTVFLRNGSRPRLDLCTAREVDNAIRVMESHARDREFPKIRRLKAAREMMEPYCSENPEIKWWEVKKKELERRDFDRLVGA